MKEFLLCTIFAFGMASTMLTAQDIQVIPQKEFLLADTLGARFGAEFTSKDPMGRRAFAQWLTANVDLSDIRLQDFAVTIFGFKVDENGKLKKIKILYKQHANLAEKLEKALEKSPAWIPMKENGKNVSSSEVFGIIFQQAKDNTLKPAYFVSPQYPKDGVGGYMDHVDKILKDPDFRFQIKEYISRDQNLVFEFLIDKEGKLHAKVQNAVSEDFAAQIKRKLERSDKWIPGLYLTRVMPYSFSYSYQIKAWNEALEGEKIEQSKDTETSATKEQQRRAAERQRQSEIDAMRQAGGGGGGAGRNR